VLFGFLWEVGSHEFILRGRVQILAAPSELRWVLRRAAELKKW
jgi:hypothetical protein